MLTHLRSMFRDNKDDEKTELWKKHALTEPWQHFNVLGVSGSRWPIKKYEVRLTRSIVNVIIL